MTTKKNVGEMTEEEIEEELKSYYPPGVIYNYEGQPARRLGEYGENIQVYLGGGRWIDFDDSRSGGMGYASPLSPERAKELIAHWDANPMRPRE